MKNNKSKYMTITVKCEDLDCVKKVIAIINNRIYEEAGIVSEYNLELLDALLGEHWQRYYDIGTRYIEIDKEVKI